MAPSCGAGKDQIRNSRRADADGHRREKFFLARMSTPSVTGSVLRTSSQARSQLRRAEQKGAKPSGQRLRGALHVGWRKQPSGATAVTPEKGQKDKVSKPVLRGRGELLKPSSVPGRANKANATAVRKELARRGYASRKEFKARKDGAKEETFAATARPVPIKERKEPRRKDGAEIFGKKPRPSSDHDGFPNDATLQEEEQEKTFEQPEQRQSQQQRVQPQLRPSSSRSCKSSRRLRSFTPSHDEATPALCAQVRSEHRTRIGRGRPPFQGLRAGAQDPMGQAENLTTGALHVFRSVGANVERKVGESNSPACPQFEGNPSDCFRFGRLGYRMASLTSTRSFQPAALRGISRRTGACDSIPPQHDRAGAQLREASSPALAQLRRSEQRSAGAGKGLEKGQKERTWEGQRQQQAGGGQVRNLNDSRRPCSAKPGLNSLSVVAELSNSKGSFGRFLRLMHGKATGLGQRTPSSSCRGHTDLFPSLLGKPASNVAPDSSKRSSRRGRGLSWLWTQTLWSLFTFLEGGCPCSKKDQLLLLDRAASAVWTEHHEALAGSLHSQIKRFIRLKCKEPLSRGNLKLEELIKKIRPFNSNYHPGPYTVEEMCQTAMNVKPDRMSLPEKAGILDPRQFLKGENLAAFESMPHTVPHDMSPNPPTRGVFKVLKEDVKQVFGQLLHSGVACLLPVEKALRDSSGNLITGGLFAVPHKEHSDRVIFDRRPQNELERRLIMAKLPHGSLLTQLIIDKHESIRGSGDDLSNYFYLLQHHPDWLGRNCVGQPIVGKDYVEFGADPKKKYLLAFRVIAMGDCNAVDLAQETHLQILKDCGAMQDGETISFKKPLPPSNTLEGLYIDDHLILQIVPNRKHRGQQVFRDEEILRCTREQYKRLGVPISAKKQFSKKQNFTAWGTNVDNASGRVGVPLEKLKQLSHLIVDVCNLEFVGLKLLQKTVGLLVHPAMHRRLFMSLLQDTYQFIAKLQPKKQYRMPVGVREELLWMCMCLPVMHSNARWPVSNRVGASDASLSGGGRAACLTTGPIAKTLYRYSEHTGEPVRLDWSKGAVEPVSTMKGAPLELENLMLAHSWTTSHKCKFSHRQHINILEMKMIKAELKALVKESTDPCRAVLLVDSRVCVGAFGKGRSSSRQLNRILRSMIGWSVAGQKTLHLIWIGTKANPADHPSRGVDIPDPQPEAPILVSVVKDADLVKSLQTRKSNQMINKFAKAGPSGVSFAAARLSPPAHPALREWTFREIFAGKGCLSGNFVRQNCFQVARPFELIQRGRPSKQHDILDDVTFDKLCAEASRPRQIWHFGMPCSSFSLLQGLNHGSRSKKNPYGDGSLDREVKGNELLHRTLYLCQLLTQHGSFFTFAHPYTSFVWDMPILKTIMQEVHARFVVLDQCQFGLKIPDGHGGLGYVRKRTTFSGTLPGLEGLEKQCSCSHSHIQVLGGVSTNSGWQKRSTLAGAYPHMLCQAYHKICLRLFDA